MDVGAAVAGMVVDEAATTIVGVAVDEAMRPWL